MSIPAQLFAVDLLMGVSYWLCPYRGQSSFMSFFSLICSSVLNYALSNYPSIYRSRIYLIWLQWVALDILYVQPFIDCLQALFAQPSSLLRRSWCQMLFSSVVSIGSFTVDDSTLHQSYWHPDIGRTSAGSVRLIFQHISMAFLHSGVFNIESNNWSGPATSISHYLLPGVDILF